MLATNQGKKWLLKQMVCFRENYCKTTWKKSRLFSTHFFEVEATFQISMNEFLFWLHWKKSKLKGHLNVLYLKPY